MKKRTLTISLIVLAIMLLVGIGYAGWVISSVKSGETSGNFTAYNVETENLTVSDTSNNSVTFGYLAPSQAFTNPWLTYDAQVELQDLTAAFTISWSNDVASGSTVTLNLAHTFYTIDANTSDEVEMSSTDLTNLQKLITGPSYSIDVAATVAEVGAGGDTIILKDGYRAGDVITVTVTYAWGPSFNNQNPYIFFNSNAANDDPSTSNPSISYASPAESSYEELAQHTLAALFTLTNGLKYKVEVSKNA